MRLKFPNKCINESQTGIHAISRSTKMNSMFYCRECVPITNNNYIGKTSFTKIRFDPSSLKVTGDDYTFSKRINDNFVPYATAGDCFSLSYCPQGSFSIDLNGTGFAVSNKTHWNKYGNRASVKILIEKNYTRIYGICGGYCGKCTPFRKTGLILMIDTS
ncbi:A disintegrin and metalloproteinase with thrombospondin motifs 20-like [Gordionus sp. m RMFG-2023]|uniref:A disintegrin and metalloproteinase with thrombospondin motifs 20-like n=1 Tax=Gordionus sp. m RMFG-2023 TaxID=3053472 RepID=UPI0031FD0FC6